MLTSVLFETESGDISSNEQKEALHLYILCRNAEVAAKVKGIFVQHHRYEFHFKIIEDVREVLRVERHEPCELCIDSSDPSALMHIETLNMLLNPRRVSVFKPGNLSQVVNHRKALS